MIRRRFLRHLEVVARGEDPKAAIRDPILNHSDHREILPMFWSPF